jgi:hypothetical protein
MIQRRCAVCGQPVLPTSTFVFEQEALMHTRCWPPLARLPHTYSEGEQRWVTTHCAECGWVDTTSWIEKQPPGTERRGKSRGSRGQN